MPALEPASVVVEMKGHSDGSRVTSIVMLPCGNRVVTASSNGKVHVCAAASGALEREIDARPELVRDCGILAMCAHLRPLALCALGGDVIASGGWCGKVVTWDAATGARLCDAAVAAGAFDCVYALASLGDGRFAAGITSGDVVFCAHSGGRDVTETARVSRAHSREILDLAACGGRLATASADKTAAVWDVASRERLATLRGHTHAVLAVDMSDRLVVTGSLDHTVRVYSAAGGYECVAVLGWLHSSWVTHVQIVSDDVVLSAGCDRTVCVTRVSTRAVVARVEVDRPVLCAAILADGRLAVGGRGYAVLIAPPAAAADAFAAHGAAAFPHAAAVARALAVAESLPPLQGSVVRVIAGHLSAAVACRDVISERACSASLAEWWAAHVLLMRAVQDGDIPAKTEYEGEENWWFRCLYAQARKLVVGEKSRASVLKCVRDACTAGVLETTESTVATIIARQDLQEVVAVFRSAEKRIVSAVGQLFARQAETDRRLTQHVAKCKRFRDVQRTTQLVGAVFSWVPFVSAALAGVGGLAEVAWGNMEATNVVESLVGIGAGSQALVSEPFVDRFMRSTRAVLDESVYNAMPKESRRVLDSAIAGVGMTASGLRALAVSVVGDGAGVGEVPDAVDAAGVGGMEDAAAGRRQSDGGGHGGGADGGASDCGVAVKHTERRGMDDTRPERDSVDAAHDDGGGDGGKATTDGQPERAEEMPVGDELASLEEQGLGRELVCGMKTAQLASALAAYMVGYDCELCDQFVETRRCVAETYRKHCLHGRRLCGRHALSAETFYEITMDALSNREGGADAKTDGLAVRAFFDEICN